MFVLYDELSAILSYLLCKPSRDRHSAFQNRLFVKSFWTSWPPRSWPRPTSYYYSPCWQNWELLRNFGWFNTVCWVQIIIQFLISVTTRLWKQVYKFLIADVERKKSTFFCVLIKGPWEEKILKGSLDLIPSVKIQIMGGKVCLRGKGKALLGIVNKLYVFKSLLTTPSNVLPLYRTATIQMLKTQWRVTKSNLLSLLKFS